MSKYYTPSEANQTLVTLRPVIGELMQIAERIRAHQPEMWSVIQKSAGNGGNPKLSALLPDFDKLDLLVHQVQDMGIVIKDLTLGLVDFPSLRDGDVVYLCWKFGETSIQFWHEIESGFAGRQKIDWD